MSLQGNIAVEVELRSLLKLIETLKREGKSDHDVLAALIKRMDDDAAAAKAGWL